MQRPPGPRTRAAKEAVRWNATKHAILAISPVVPGMENEKDWLEYRNGVLESLQPETQLEWILAERVALSLWRERRVILHETAQIRIKRESITADVTRRIRSKLGLKATEDATEVLKSKATELRRAHSELDEFLSAGKDSKYPSTVTLNVITIFTDEVLTKIEHEQTTKSRNPLSGDLKETPGVSGSQQTELDLRLKEVAEEFSRLTGLFNREVIQGELMKGLEEFATNLGFDFEEVFGAAFDHLESQADDAEEQAAAIVHRQQQALMVRTLPDKEVLEKIQRYESHLRRLMIRDLHELEALQARRFGEAAPLARIDIASDGDRG